MRRILSRLFGSLKAPESGADTDPAMRIPVAIPIPEYIDPDATQRVPASLFRTYPAEAARQMAKRSAELFALDRSRAETAGCVAYTWRTSGDESVCEVCRAREGVRFLYANEPEHGHAGVCRVCPQGRCRCYAEPILPDE